ncbi:MAG: TonB-dependent receptor [Acidobacteria bacterium]|nr:TonB-dependent receptor [Acidobacteriota bacterium]
MRLVRPLLVAIIPFLLCLGAAATARGQETVNYGSISGRVLDASEAGIAGADVRVRQLDTNVTSTAVTDDVGRFRFPYLRVGPYEIAVRARGFATATRRLVLNVSGAFDVPFVLAVGAIEDAVTVTADAPIIETARSQIAATVPRTEITAMPLNGRNFLDLALLVPGVAPPNVGGGTQLFAETSAVPGVSLSVSGQRNLSNSFIVDGLSANDDAAALSGISFGVDALEQVQVVTSGGQAELGRALGGYVNVVTRSGTNDLRAEMYTFVRDDGLTAKNALSGRTLPMHQDQAGATLGGPIARNRTFFFGNVEVRRLDQSGIVTISAADAAAINRRLADVGYGGPGAATGVYANPIDTTHGVARLDHHFADGDHVFLRYSLYDAASRNARGAGGINAPSASSGLDNLDQTIAAGHVRSLSDRTVLETRAQFARSALSAPPSDPVGPAVSIAGIAAFGTSSGSPTGRVSNMIEVVTNLSHQAGAHALRVGLDLLHNDVTITYPRAFRGSYSFSSLANFLAGTYNTAGFTQTFGETTVAQRNPNVGLYVQDEWRVRDRLTLNVGLRYDLQFLETIHVDTDNLSPRVGIVWSPSDSGRSVLRASYGRFYDRIPLRALANALLSAGNTTDLTALRQISVSLSPAQAGAPSFPRVLGDVVPTTTLVNLTTMDRHIRNAHADQASVEFERQIAAQGSVSVGVDYVRGRELIMQINQNVPACTASGSNNGCRPNAAYANNNQYSSAGASDYKALHVSIVQRPAGWLSYRAAYTLAKAMNNVGETFFASPIDPFDLSKDWGRSDSDRRHTLMVLTTAAVPAAAASGLWQAVTRGFQVSGVVQAYSALPFNITTGANTIQGTPARPVVDGRFIARNAGTGSPFSMVNMRVSRAFTFGRRTTIEGLLDIFNLLNQRNDVARIGVFGTGSYPSSPAANFGQVTVVGEPRSLQVGLRVRY